MQDKFPHNESDRRIGLNPASDYGGRDQMSIANEAIKTIKKEEIGTSLDESQQDQLSLLLPDTLDVDPNTVSETAEEEAARKRAMLGSRATKGTVSKPDDIVTPRKTARDRQFDNIAATEARRNLRRSLNARGRGPGA